MTRHITIDEFLRLSIPVPLMDVRTPAEFDQGHIPGALNLPLFTNEERVRVGTTYKQAGREAAILLGFDLTGPKWSGLIRQALEMAPGKKIGIHCWRGGMRSGVVSWALDLYGFEVYLIEGGYKSYRKWVHAQFHAARQLMILGGMTGSGKTAILQQMKTNGQQVIDLEQLAGHRGSAYGSMNKLIQPTQEQFENNLAHQLNKMDSGSRIWVEDESQAIGRCLIPITFWHQMGNASLVEVKVGLQQRINTLVQEYGVLDKDFLAECTERITKRLGAEHTKHAIQAIRDDRMEDFIRSVLVYYDKAYRTALLKRSAEQIFPVALEGMDIENSATILSNFISHTHKDSSSITDYGNN